jgi:hypothetical protein
VLGLTTRLLGVLVSGCRVLARLPGYRVSPGLRKCLTDTGSGEHSAIRALVTPPYLGGTFRRLRYDNLGSAVKKILRGFQREETARFIAFRSDR